MLAISTGCAEPIKPNVILYVVDTLRADCLSPYGNDVIETPHARRLAESGVLYSHAYAHSSWTRPSVTSILTGLPPDLHGVETRFHDAPDHLRLLAEAFREEGYSTAAVVTNPNVGRYFGFDQGYDEFIELFAKTEKGIVSAISSRAPSSRVTDRAIEWIGKTRGPFFLFVLTTDPHWPYRPPEPFKIYDDLVDEPTIGDGQQAPAENRRLSRYYGEVSFNDDSFGRLWQYMRNREPHDNTVVVLTADHGEEFGEHGGVGHGRVLFEESVRVPLIIHDPRSRHAGLRVDTSIGLVDLYPTLLHVAGLPMSAELRRHILPPEGPAGNRKVFARLDLDDRRGEMLLDPPWKYVMAKSFREGEEATRGGLFDLRRDPAETRDLEQEETSLAREMKQQLAARTQANESPLREQGGVARELTDEVRQGLEAIGYLGSGPNAPPADTR